MADLKILLSASIPLFERDDKYFATADRIAIRDAVRGFGATVLPRAEIHWGGHPSITPLIKAVAADLELPNLHPVYLYQSRFFDGQFPPENSAFEKIVLTPAFETSVESLRQLRMHMISAVEYDAAVFIGGMEGVETEFDLFRSTHPNAPVLPVASTGAAARLIFDRVARDLNLSNMLLTDYGYAAMFRALLLDGRSKA